MSKDESSVGNIIDALSGDNAIEDNVLNKLKDIIKYPSDTAVENTAEQPSTATTTAVENTVENKNMPSGEFKMEYFESVYALSKEAEEEADAMGYILEEEEKAIFNGEKVRAMTYEEEMLYNEDRLTDYVDLWGNIAVDEEFDMEWYMENCI